MIIPNNLFEAISTLIEDNKGQLETIASMNEDEFIDEAHHGLGRNLRNNWGLWLNENNLSKEFENQGIHHADDRSTIILRTFHRKINNVEFDIEGQIMEYINYWSANKS